MSPIDGNQSKQPFSVTKRLLTFYTKTNISNCFFFKEKPSEIFQVKLDNFKISFSSRNKKGEFQLQFLLIFLIFQD